MGRIALLSFVICFVTVTGCTRLTPEQRQYNCRQRSPNLYCLYVESGYMGLHRKLESDISDSMAKHAKQVKLINEIVMAKDKDKIPQVLDLLRSAEDISNDYEGKETLMQFRDLSGYKAASSAYVLIVSETAAMRIDIGRMYSELGERDKAKEMYRSVVINYTGTAYRSYVKKAEFALEDLK